jgi:hypothetical protein
MQSLAQGRKGAHAISDNDHWVQAVGVCTIASVCLERVVYNVTRVPIVSAAWHVVS